MTMATPFAPTMSTTNPARGGPDNTIAPLNAEMIPKEGASKETPKRCTSAVGMVDTQTPVRNPNIQDRRRKSQ